MHVELFAASDAGRDAVRQILPDLRRDSGATLDLSSQNQPDTDRRDGRSGTSDTSRRGDRADGTTTTAGRRARLRGLPPVRPTTVRTAGLDVLA